MIDVKRLKALKEEAELQGEGGTMCIEGGEVLELLEHSMTLVGYKLHEAQRDKYKVEAIHKMLLQLNDTERAELHLHKGFRDYVTSLPTYPPQTI